MMKLLRTVIGSALLGGVFTVSALAAGSDQAKSNDLKSAKPYPLKTCVVSGEKLDGDMGKPYVFVEEGWEIKICCKGCLKDFKKEPGKYLKKLAEAKQGTKAAVQGTPAQDHNEHHH